MNKNNENIYIELQMTNVLTPLNFEQTFTQPIVNDTTGYKLAIIRFNLDTLLPVFIPLIKDIANNKNVTSYAVTMSYTNIVAGNTTFYTQNVDWEPQNLVNTDQYYYCYSFEYLQH